MFKSITLGQYYQTDSLLHRLDPRTKVVMTLGYIISLFLIRNFTGYVVAGILLAVAVVLSHVPFRFIWRGMRGIFLIICSTLMTLTTTPNQLTDALESLGRPLTRIHVPVHEIAMMMSIALRFIPILAEETDKIQKAQMARGADFESGSLVARVKALVPLLVPLFISAFRRANDLAMAMEARCYRGGEGRTKMKPLVYAGRDYSAYLLFAGYFVLVIVMRNLRMLV